MPELPEVETVRAGLVPHVEGARVVSVDVRRASCVRLMAGGADEFTGRLVGATIVTAVRRGKFLWMPLTYQADAHAGFNTPTDALSAHLGMSGQFRVHRGADIPAPHPHCRTRLVVERDGERWVIDFLDQRTFGYLHVEDLVATGDGGPGGHGSSLPALPVSVAHIGRDALDPMLDVAGAVASWRRGRRGIKQVVLDQGLVSGVGNIYADEALWLAQIHPERPAEAMSRAQAQSLLAAASDVMGRALEVGGTSFDSLYVNVNGESGYFARGLEAYGRAGEPCSRCGALLRRATVGGRATHWCAACQRRWAPRGGRAR
ncbi:bifunctional DNA-formamidopyrimidine glycosylase/DNA-(apurinic or apyrimidinic site) lyase [Demequina sp. B12]|uniref:bifunctional DNA-formamidopyrimidine glycosylase/DNA-(apurinic or apyrimidinic site) lyase n=1 Tax=Demequina sp. B12 TaxID=2992757 RepID=UPI00237AA983|nr:bifunctional DNA-formamidopyrimidine glycosylase/DNA-(apurinic or apyrimidinic site) lyase [Demequina sp. B12]MDE0572779.1 bifunctional DNA-formamidopyrimidine glycosylase/DNA-(apurinic or apyrimidinic site) lyase [Demequina sp. B12]